MKKSSKLIIILTVVSILVTVLVAFLCFRIFTYFRAEQLCEQIRNGEEIDTMLGDATTAPIILSPLSPFVEMNICTTVLVEACTHQHLQAVELLLKNGADPNFYTVGEWSPLEATIFTHHEKGDGTGNEIIRLLIDYGADVNIKTYWHATFLEQVAMGTSGSSRRETFKILVEAGADINRVEGGTVICYLLGNNQIELADWLMTQRTIDINEEIYGDLKTNPLMVAIEFRKTPPERDTVMWLIDHGIDLSHTDANGKTAYDYAVENGYTEIAQLLQDAMNQSAQP